MHLEHGVESELADCLAPSDEADLHAHQYLTSQNGDVLLARRALCERRINTRLKIFSKLRSDPFFASCFAAWHYTPMARRNWWDPKKRELTDHENRIPCGPPW